MCGIVGVVYKDKDRSCSEEQISAMRDVITHRGPDDKGIYIDNGIGRKSS